MARVMTEAHKARLAEGRALKLEQDRIAQARAADEYRQWVKLESELYAALTTAREMFGDGSTEAIEAYHDWYASIGLMPPLKSLPPDSSDLWRAP